MGFFDRIKKIAGFEEEAEEEIQPRRMPEKKVGLGPKGTFISKPTKEYKLTGAFEELARVGVPVGNFSIKVDGTFFCRTDLGDYFARLIDKKDAFDGPIIIGTQRSTEVQAYVGTIHVSSHQIRIMNYRGDDSISKIWAGEDDKVGLVQRIDEPESDLVKVFGIDDNLIAGEIIAIRERDRRYFDTMFNGDQQVINKMREKKASEGKGTANLDEVVKKILGVYGADYVDRANKVIEEAQKRYVLRGNYFIEIIDKEDAKNLEKGLYLDECSSTGGLLLLKTPDSDIIKDYMFDIQDEKRKGMPIAYGNVLQIRRLVPLLSWREAELYEASSEEMRLECVYAYPAGELVPVDTSRYPEAVWVIGDGALIETLRQSNRLVDTAKKKGAVEMPQYYFYMNINLKELPVLGNRIE